LFLKELELELLLLGALPNKELYPTFGRKPMR
jgi:hypothetical protein